MNQFVEYGQINLPEIEEKILDWWKKEDIFGRSIAQHEGEPSFTFYEGPPTANGQPGIHHVMSRTIKDVFCRYKTMKGFQVERKAGWDTHGLPVEIEVEKELGLEGRQQVEEFGIERYNAACRESVLRYKEQWDNLTVRMGYWVDQENPYVTFQTTYIESVWWLLKQIYEKGYLYEGYKIQWYSPGSNTVLSSHEVSLGYEEVQDPSVFIRFKSDEEEDTYFLAWTTTPWTLISNAALAVGPDIEYVKIRCQTDDIGTQYLILAKDRLSVIKEEYELVETTTGSDLLGKTYQPLFDYFKDEEGAENAWRVVSADYVTTEDGTGIVHTAPAFGAEDFETSKKENLPVLNPVLPDGHFTEEAELVSGLWFKDADKVISRDLRDRGLLYRHETYVHNYPHDWRKGTPLMSYPVEGWFIRTTAIKDRLIELNDQIRWQPESIGRGRFGDWLVHNVDWALSRKRFWGTPLPIWKSDAPESEYIEVIGSLEELRSKCGDQLPGNNEDVDLHRPFVDSLTWDAPDGGTMRRVEDLIDVWFDSGAMPFAQWHYPFENKDQFERSFPADFIAEAVDQTRGWFYTMHAISVLVMDELAFKNVVVNGFVLDENGEKMSKSKGNVVDPFKMIDKFGVDVIRWYMMSNAPPWEDLKFSERGLVETQRKFFNTLSNVYSFFATYANIDGFTYAENPVPVQDRLESDRWILSRLHSTAYMVDGALDDYNPTKAARAVEEFVDDLSNWYIRRNRRRFWSAKDAVRYGEEVNQKLSAYQTVAECLLSVAKLMAPLAPFFSDWLFKAVNEVVGLETSISVHLSEFPDSSKSDDLQDPSLEHRVGQARAVSSIVLALRNRSGHNVRQPLSRIMVVTGPRVERVVIEQMKDMILEEVNVRHIEYVEGSSSVVTRQARPNFKVLGKRLGPLMKPVNLVIRDFSDEQIDAFLEDGSIEVTVDGQAVELAGDDLEIVREGVEGWLVGQERGVTVALDIELTDELIAEGLARETVNRIQNMRKTADFDITDRIKITVSGSELLLAAIDLHADWIRNETLGLELEVASDPDGDLVSSFEIDSERLTVGVRRIK